MDRSDRTPGRLTRRETILLGAAAYAAAVAVPATGAVPATAGAVPMSTEPAAAGSSPPTGFSKDTDAGTLKQFAAIHQGKGSVGIKRFMFDGHPAPANFIIYDIPPGASEGVHVHHLDNRNNEGPYDEYYYIVSGQGQMQVDGQVVAVSTGDHVHTPLDTPHGIENTHSTEHLKVFLTFITRTAAP